MSNAAQAPSDPSSQSSAAARTNVTSTGEGTASSVTALPSTAHQQTSHSHYYSNFALGTDFSVLNKNPLLNRIGLEPIKRIALITTTASFWGFVLGGVIGSRQSGMQYLAENAHRLPKTMEGWYFYHKRKNYRMLWGALSRGSVYAAKTGALVGLFECLEASLDFYRGGADMFNSTIAGVASGAIFSVINKLPRQSSKHTLVLGAGYGLASGALQDLSSYLKGSPVWYLPQSLKERSVTLKIPASSKDHEQ